MRRHARFTGPRFLQGGDGEKNNPIALLILAGILVLPFTACGTQPQGPAAEATQAAAEDPVKRGEYLVSVLGCDDCHTAKTMGPQGPQLDLPHRLAGHFGEPALPAPPVLPEGPWGVVTTMSLTAWAGPWGISYGTNLTPDRETGMGAWTEAMFVKAIRTGKHMSAGRPILPPMPWEAYARLTDEDLKAVFAFLRTLPPVANKVPDPVLAPPPPGPGGGR